MNPRDVYALLIILTSFVGMLAGFGLGYTRAQKKYIPEIVEANYEIAKLKTLARLNSPQ